ncbi:Mur ligase domain-containing protein [Myxococcota bacterium]|nr:Mur ligase domain-containing protein [Myxococcota bacterium]
MTHVHFIAIGGTGMASLAGLLHARGVRVTGSDDVLYPPMSTLLEDWGIPVHTRFRAEHVLSDVPDLVVIGNAVGPDNVEARAAIDEGLTYRSFPDALFELAIGGKHPVVVSGTHGKTTTTCLVSSLLNGLGWDPSLLVGGHSLDFDGSFREGHGDHFVVEGDEYDTAFFDKTPKFLHYGARTLIITSVEFDHADIYYDLDHVKEAFRSCVAQLPSDGMVVAALDRPNVREVVADAPCRVVGYGTTDSATTDWGAGDVRREAGGMSFAVRRDGSAAGRAFVPLFGQINVANALAALATVTELGGSLAEAVEALGRFKGVKRRQEIRGERNSVTVVDDFAHHPTAVRGSLDALRAQFPNGRIVAVFEPRTNTSRRKIFQQDYALAFDAADRVIVSVVPDTPIYSATGEVTETFSSEQLVADLVSRGMDARAWSDIDDIVTDVVRFSEPGDIVLVMSNGSFGGICQRLLDAL